MIISRPISTATTLSEVEGWKLTISPRINVMTPRKIVVCQARAIPIAGGKSVPGCSICMCHTFLHDWARVKPRRCSTPRRCFNAGPGARSGHHPFGMMVRPPGSVRHQGPPAARAALRLFVAIAQLPGKLLGVDLGIIAVAVVEQHV